ncbi:DUF3489 domain-containing protein [Pontivivens ytuae]|uniref:DUF3489 domain-containing protein n=1 Tax=Pontivivens ytuae TaxID=2789856 RepID=A0A7S9QD54_9RHOB|nr:DUF3489 domain-containing protein [Pontivivens ytuae]QPH54933.1 DUF3489 domain-containing protein [Pontivivens ytuae]
MTNATKPDELPTTQTAKKPTPTRESQATELRQMLARRNGATITQLQERFGWQPHSARAAISMLRKSGEHVERVATPKGSVYRLRKAPDGAGSEA